jgi:hypothetical protein
MLSLPGNDDGRKLEKNGGQKSRKSSGKKLTPMRSIVNWRNPEIPGNRTMSY